jgi:hypothetical protein
MRAATMSIHLEAPTLRRAEEFVAAVRRSRALHRGLVEPPRTREEDDNWFIAYCPEVPET